jgi:uncharacterized LabA/DUF88 family protein
MQDTTKFEEILKLIKNKRVLTLIDGGNIYFSTHIKKLEIDYGLMHNQIRDNCKELIEMVFYTAFRPNEKKQNQFFEYLESVGITIFKKPIKVFKNDVKGNLDVELTVDAMQKIKSYDVLVLLSGDGDFTYLVKTLEATKKTVLVFSFKGFTAHELMAEANNNYYLEDITKLWQSPKNQEQKPSKNILEPLHIQPKKFFKLPSLSSLPNPMNLFKPKIKPLPAPEQPTKNTDQSQIKGGKSSSRPRQSPVSNRRNKPNPQNQARPTKPTHHNKPENKTSNPLSNSHSKTNKPANNPNKSSKSVPIPQPQYSKPIKPITKSAKPKPNNNPNKPKPTPIVNNPNPNNHKKPRPIPSSNNYNKPRNNQNERVSEVQIHLD